MKMQNLQIKETGKKCVICVDSVWKCVSFLSTFVSKVFCWTKYSANCVHVKRTAHTATLTTNFALTLWIRLIYITYKDPVHTSQRMQCDFISKTDSLTLH